MFSYINWFRFILCVLTFGVSFSVFSQCDSIPQLNEQIIQLVEGKMGKKVDRGECWDLARYVLDKVGAKWDGQYVYGQLLAKKDCISSGDIIQFEKVVVKYKNGNKTITEKMLHHTAIVYNVKSSDFIELAHQNTGFSGKKVGKSFLQLSTIKSGSIMIYRPVKKIV